MDSSNSKLIIISTNYVSISQLLRKFNLTTSREIKLVSFSESIDDVDDFNSDPASIDLMIIPDNIRDVEILFEHVTYFSESKQQVLLSLHQSDEEKHNKKKLVENVVGLKLIHPVLNEHSGSGLIFEFLKQLSAKWLERDEAAYYDEISRLVNSVDSTVDSTTESKLILLSYCNTLENVELLLNKRFDETREFKVKIDSYIDDPFIHGKLQDFLESTNQSPIDLLLELRTYLFKN